MSKGKIKTRKQKAELYEKKYSQIPRDYQERLSWMYDHYHLTTAKATSIIKIRDEMLSSIKFEKEIFVILYEIPEGAPRPRARFINKNNLSNMAKNYPGYIQMYSLTGFADREYMNKLITEQDYLELDYLINTPCYVEYDVYLPTPVIFNSIDTFLAELGYIRPIIKPDFDNIEKKYSDMYNGNVWLDDSLVIESRFRKFYSILPRVEITLRYLNKLYNKYQYNMIVNRIGDNTNVKYFEKE